MRRLERNPSRRSMHCKTEVSWNLKHTPDQQRTQSQHTLLACQPSAETQVEEEEEDGLCENSLPEQPFLWDMWVPDPQTGEQLRL